jgi:hypothetical protein
MKYRVFETETEARAAQQEIYASFLRDRAALNGGKLDDWSNLPIWPVSVETLPNPDLIGQRFPLYGQRASDMVFITEYGHTTSWASPTQIGDGRWVFPSPDDTGEEAGNDWFPPPPPES